MLGAAQADVLVVTARVDGEPGSRDGLALLLVDPASPGVRLTPFRTVDGRSAAHVAFDSVEVAADACLSTDAYAALTAALRDATVVAWPPRRSGRWVRCCGGRASSPRRGSSSACRSPASRWSRTASPT